LLLSPPSAPPSVGLIRRPSSITQGPEARISESGSRRQEPLSRSSAAARVIDGFSEPGFGNELVVEEKELLAAPGHGTIERGRERIGRKLTPGACGRVEDEIRLPALLVGARIRDNLVACLDDAGEAIGVARR
jgi:hypothetical protein